MTSCPFCNRPVAGECQRYHCRFRRQFRQRRTLLPPPPLDPNVSDLPESATTRTIDGIAYDVVWDGTRDARDTCARLVGLPVTREDTGVSE